MEIYSDGSFIADDSTVYFSITSDISIEHKKLAKLYIEDGGLMRTRMDALGLDDDERLEELVLECERHWDSVINRIKGQAMIPDLAERSASFAYGRGVAETYSINGDAMLQAVKKMAVSTVDTMHEKVEMNDDIRARHEFVVIAMVVEALFGLQNNHVDGFRRELLGESLKKVEQYLAFEKQYGEDAVQFELRTTKSDAADREAEHAKIYKRQENDIYALKLKNKALQEKVDHNPNLPLQERGEADVQFENRTLQDKIIRIEKDRDYQVRQLDSAGKHKDDALKLLEGQCQELQHKTMRQGIKILNHTQENRQLKYENLKFRNNALEPSKKIKQLEKEALEGLKSRTELLDSEEKVSQLQEEVSQLQEKYAPLEEKYAKRKIQAQDFKTEINQLKKKIVQRKDDCTKLKDAYVKLKKHRHEAELAVDETELEFNKELEVEKAKSARLQARLDRVGA
jgi:hypothetical protein